MGNYEQLKQSVSDVIKTNGNQEITGSILQNVLLTIISTVGANATFAGIATPTTNPGTPDGPVFWLASESGTYSNFNAIELQDGLSVLMWNGSWSSQQIFGIDDVPTAGSDNLVKSGGVQEELALGAVYDVSAKNPTAGVNNDGKWESLSALLSDANLNTLIPTAVRKGGMSIKFVQSSGNKYVQARCMAQDFTADVTQWQISTKIISEGSENLMESGGIFTNALIKKAQHFNDSEQKRMRANLNVQGKSETDNIVKEVNNIESTYGDIEETLYNVSKTTNNVKLTPTTRNYYVNASGGQETSNPSLTSLVYNIEGLDKVFLNGNSRVTSDNCRWAFMMEDEASPQSMITFELGDTSTPNKEFEYIEIPVPAEAKYLFTTKNSYAAKYYLDCYKRVTNTTLDNKVNVTLPITERTADSYINSSKEYQSSNGFYTDIYNVSGLSSVYITGKSRGGSALYRYAFSSSNLPANIISGLLGDDSTPNLIFDNEQIDVPNGATHLFVTQNPVVDRNEQVFVQFKEKNQKINNLTTAVFGKQTTLLSTNLNANTFTGAVNKTFKDIQTKWAGAKIFVCTPLKSGGYPNEDNNENVNMTYLTQNRIYKFEKDFSERIKECAKIYSFPIIDLDNESCINPLNAASAAIFTHNTTDKLHPILAGHKRIAEVIYNHIKNAYPTTDFEGAKAIFIGDSITSNIGQHTSKVYYKFLSEWLNLRDDGMKDNGLNSDNTAESPINYPKNAGIAGCGYSRFCPTDNPIYNRLQSYADDYDLVIVFAGVNDFMCKKTCCFGEIFE